MQIITYIADLDELKAWIFENISILKGKHIALEGNLGVGKTAFVKFLALALDIKGIITSPSFNKMLTYPGLVHIDAYQLHDDLSFYEDYFDNNTVVIEWASLLIENYDFDLIIKIDFVEDETKRKYEVVFNENNRR